MADSTLVIKVKYGDTLRRFNAQIIDEQLVDFNMERLRLKILTLFDFTTDTLLTLTYTDEDGDEVTLVDEDDLREVVRQGLDPLRITVKLNNEKKSPGVNQPFQNLKPNVSEILKSVPEPIHDTVRKFLIELRSKVSSSAPVIPELVDNFSKKFLTELSSKESSSAAVISELVDHFSKMGLSYLEQISNSRPEEQSNAQNEVSEGTKNQESSKVDSSTSKEKPSERHDGSGKGKYIPEKPKVDPTKGAFPPPSQKYLPPWISKSPAPVRYPPHMPRFPSGHSVGPSPVIEIPFSASPGGNGSAIPPYFASQIGLMRQNGGSLQFSDVKGRSLGASSSSNAPEAVNVNVGKPSSDSPFESVSVDPQPRAVPGSSIADSTENVHSKPLNCPSDVQKVFDSMIQEKMAAPVSYPAHVTTYVSSDGVWMGPRPVNESSSAFTPYSAPQIKTFNQNDGSVPIIHRGVECDGCGVSPITGPRFKSIVKSNYDLCSVCFERMGNDHDYIEIGSPMPYQHPPSMEMMRTDSMIQEKMAAPVSYPAHVTTYVSSDSVWMGPRPVSESSSAFTPYSAPQIKTFNQNDGSVPIIHRGVECDGCGVSPITGPRFKSIVKSNYDLCSVCFERMGNDHDYIGIGSPMPYQHPPSMEMMPTGAMRQAGQQDAIRRAFMETIRQGNAAPVAPKLDSHFVRDMNITDGTVMAPLTPFTKIWLMRNNGTSVWPQKTQLVWVGGDKLNNAVAIDMKVPPSGLLVGMVLKVGVDFIAPETAGRYVSFWRLASPTGQQFGQRIWVQIEVDDSVKAQHASVHDFNLNLSPPSSSLAGAEIKNMELDHHHSQPSNSNDTMEVGEPMVDVNSNNEQHEKKFPINDSLLVGTGGGPHSGPSAPPSSISYPEIDFTEVAPVFPPPPPSIPVQASSQQVPQKNEVEEKLLTELKAMGFKQVHLNKEILRKNAYDLQQSVDDLCNVYEWDPMLEELHAMGFKDTQLNKKLLEKNDGSISRVVMDLISGDQH